MCPLVEVFLWTLDTGFKVVRLGNNIPPLGLWEWQWAGYSCFHSLGPQPMYSTYWGHNIINNGWFTVDPIPAQYHLWAGTSTVTSSGQSIALSGQYLLSGEVHKVMCPFLWDCFGCVCVCACICVYSRSLDPIQYVSFKWPRTECSWCQLSELFCVQCHLLPLLWYWIWYKILHTLCPLPHIHPHAFWRRKIGSRQGGLRQRAWELTEP